MLKQPFLPVVTAAFLLLGLAAASAQEGCAAPSGTKLRIKVPDIPQDRLVLSWEGKLDCELSGAELGAALNEGFIQLNVPAAELKEDGTSAPVSLTASETGGRQGEITVELTSRGVGFDPKIFFYFNTVPNTEASIAVIDKLLTDGEIYKAYFMSRDLMRKATNYNIRLVATYFYYQAAIQIDASPRFSQGRMRVSTDARKRMVAVIKSLEDERSPDHEPYRQAFANKGRLLRSISDIKFELGFDPLSGGATRNAP